jgi:hypothetical protein
VKRAIKEKETARLKWLEKHQPAKRDSGLLPGRESASGKNRISIECGRRLESGGKVAV